MEGSMKLMIPYEVTARIRRERVTILTKTLLLSVLLGLCEYFYLFSYFQSRAAKYTKSWIATLVAIGIWVFLEILIVRHYGLLKCLLSRSWEGKVQHVTVKYVLDPTQKIIVSRGGLSGGSGAGNLRRLLEVGLRMTTSPQIGAAPKKFRRKVLMPRDVFDSPYHDGDTLGFLAGTKYPFLVDRPEDGHIDHYDYVPRKPGEHKPQKLPRICVFCGVQQMTPERHVCDACGTALIEYIYTDPEETW